MSEAKLATHDGFNVVEEVSQMEFINRESPDHSEYIHLVPDKAERELRCYRSIGGVGENERLKTTISDVSFSSYGSVDIDEVEYFYLTYMEAMSFMSYLVTVATSRKSTLGFDWSDSDGGTMMDDEATSMEAITINYDDVEGNERPFQIRSEWQSETHRMANIEGEGGF